MISREIIPDLEKNAFLSYLISGDQKRCEDLIELQILRGVPVKWIYGDLIQDALYEIGCRWSRGNVSVGAEHVASALAEVLLARLYPSPRNKGPGERRAIICCAPDENHRIGPRIVSDFMELHGWTACFLGGGLPAAEIENFVVGSRPDVLGLSLCRSEAAPALASLLAQLAKRLPETEVLLGGQGLSDNRGMNTRAELIKLHPRARYLSGLDDLDRYLIGSKEGS